MTLNKSSWPTIALLKRSGSSLSVNLVNIGKYFTVNDYCYLYDKRVFPIDIGDNYSLVKTLRCLFKINRYNNSIVDYRVYKKYGLSTPIVINNSLILYPIVGKKKVFNYSNNPSGMFSNLSGFLLYNYSSFNIVELNNSLSENILLDSYSTEVVWIDQDHIGFISQGYLFHTPYDVDVVLLYHILDLDRLEIVYVEPLRMYSLNLLKLPSLKRSIFYNVRYSVIISSEIKVVELDSDPYKEVLVFNWILYSNNTVEIIISTLGLEQLTTIPGLPENPIEPIVVMAALITLIILRKIREHFSM